MFSVSRGRTHQRSFSSTRSTRSPRVVLMRRLALIVRFVTCLTAQCSCHSHACLPVARLATALAALSLSRPGCSVTEACRQSFAISWIGLPLCTKRGDPGAADPARAAQPDGRLRRHCERQGAPPNTCGHAAPFRALQHMWTCGICVHTACMDTQVTLQTLRFC